MPRQCSGKWRHSFTNLDPGEPAPPTGTYCIGGWVGPTTGLEKRKMLPLMHSACTAHSSPLYRLRHPAASTYCYYCKINHKKLRGIS
jgi:hypothetical protein